MFVFSVKKKVIPKLAVASLKYDAISSFWNLPCLQRCHKKICLSGLWSRVELF